MEDKKTVDQRRAQHAWAAVQEAKKKNNAKEIRTVILGLPAQIIGSGLGPAIAFVHAKGKADVILSAISDWVLDKRWHPGSAKPKPAAGELIRSFADGDSAFLKRATEETLAYLQWLKRFAEAELPK